MSDRKSKLYEYIGIIDAANVKFRQEGRITQAHISSPQIQAYFDQWLVNSCEDEYEIVHDSAMDICSNRDIDPFTKRHVMVFVARWAGRFMPAMFVFRVNKLFIEAVATTIWTVETLSKQAGDAIDGRYLIGDYYGYLFSLSQVACMADRKEIRQSLIEWRSDYSGFFRGFGQRRVINKALKIIG